MVLANLLERIAGASGARIDLLFTMSDSSRPRGSKPARGRENQVKTDEHVIPAGGARRDRTDDLLLAKQALSQLSYGPGRREGPRVSKMPDREKDGGPGKI